MEQPQEVLDVVTENGSVYRLNLKGHKTWIKHSHRGWTDPIESLHVLMVGDDLVEPWRNPKAWTEAEAPVVGKHMYVASNDVWWVSMPVVKIVETVATAPWTTLDA